MSNQKKNRYVNNPESNSSPKTTKALSEDEQMLQLADIISNVIINEMLNHDEESS